MEYRKSDANDRHLSRRLLIFEGGTAALVGVLAGLSPKWASAAASAATSKPASHATQQASTMPSALIVEGKMVNSSQTVELVARNSHIELRQLEFRLSREGIVALLAYTFAGGNDDTQAAFELQLLSKAKRVVGKQVAAGTKRLPPEPSEEHGNVKWVRITDPRYASFEFEGISSADISDFRLEVTVK